MLAAPPNIPIEIIREERLRRKAESSLAEYAKQAWHVLEPATPLKWGWALDVMSEHLEAITYGHIQRLMTNVPPGLMKSLMTNVFWPSWEWGPRSMPWLRFVSTAHKEPLAIRDNIKCRRLITSKWYQDRWPIKLVSDQNMKMKFENDSTGFRECMTYVSMTGTRGDRVLVDDPISADHANSAAHLEAALISFKESQPTRLNGDDSAEVIICQRLNENDIPGHVLREALDYVHLMLPMEFEPERRCYTVVKPRHSDMEPVTGKYHRASQCWYIDGQEIPDEKQADLKEEPEQLVYLQDRRTQDGELLFTELFPHHRVERLKKRMMEYATAGQFQQRPAPRGGGMFKKDNFQYVDICPSLIKCARGWDLASTKKSNSPRTSGVKVGMDKDGRVIVVDVRKGRWGPSQVETEIKAAAVFDGANVVQDFPQDPGQAGKAQVNSLAKKLHGHNFKSSPESGDKETRAIPFAAQVEAHNVYLVRATWNYAFVEEASTFPAGALKDQIDAASRAYAAILGQESQLIGAAPTVIDPKAAGSSESYADHRTGEGYVPENQDPNVAAQLEIDYSGLFINVKA